MTEAVLTSLRQEIDDIDQQIIDLLKARLEVVERVIETKKQHDLPVRIEDRIRLVIEGRDKIAVAQGLPEGFVAAVYEAIVEQTCLHEEKFIK